MQDIQIIILAAGAGTRMKSNRPKVLLPVNGKPLIFHLLETIDSLALELPPAIIVGHRADEIKEELGDEYVYIEQTERRGTADAVRSAKDALSGKSKVVLTFFADTPFISKGSIVDLVETQIKRSPAFTMGMTRVPYFEDWYKGFHDFGRIILDQDGNIVGNIEKRHFTPEIAERKEVNPGFYCFDAKWLWENIDKVPPTPPSNEYYLPGMIDIARAQERNIASVEIDPRECLGANTPEHLREMENIAFGDPAR